MQALILTHKIRVNINHNCDKNPILNLLPRTVWLKSMSQVLIQKEKKRKAKEKYKFQLKYFDEKLTTFPTLKL